MDQKQISSGQSLNNMIEQERITAINEIITTVNHEINNPLTAIIGNTELLDLELKSGNHQKLASALDSIASAAQQIKQVTQQLANITSSKTEIYAGRSRMTSLS